MLRRLAVAMGVAAACGLAAGCGGSSGSIGSPPGGTLDKMKDAVAAGEAKAKEAAEGAAAAAKETVVKPIVDAYPKIEEKIKAMSGDAAKAAGEKFEALKNLVHEFKTAEKWEDIKDKLVKAFEDLKKAVGL